MKNANPGQRPTAAGVFRRQKAVRTSLGTRLDDPFCAHNSTLASSLLRSASSIRHIALQLSSVLGSYARNVMQFLLKWATICF